MRRNCLGHHHPAGKQVTRLVPANIPEVCDSPAADRPREDKSPQMLARPTSSRQGKTPGQLAWLSAADTLSFRVAKNSSQGVDMIHSSSCANAGS